MTEYMRTWLFSESCLERRTIDSSLKNWDLGSDLRGLVVLLI